MHLTCGPTFVSSCPRKCNNYSTIPKITFMLSRLVTEHPRHSLTPRMPNENLKQQCLCCEVRAWGRLYLKKESEDLRREKGSRRERERSLPMAGRVPVTKQVLLVLSFVMFQTDCVFRSEEGEIATYSHTRYTHHFPFSIKACRPTVITTPFSPYEPLSSTIFPAPNDFLERQH
jgi:hypothetical protein